MPQDTRSGTWVMNRLDGKIAVVTGGTQGLGLAVARLFANSGAKGIVTCGRSADKGLAAAEEISRSTDAEVAFVTADLSSVDDCRRVIATAGEKFGSLDVLVNAGAITDRGTLLDTSPELFDEMMAVNLRGPFFLMQEAAKLMISKKAHGSIINIGSMSAHAGQPFITVYCASKGGLATLTRNAAFSLLCNQIRVNQLNIGWMASDGENVTQRKFHGAKDDWAEEAGKQLPAGRLLDPAEVARAVAFLASDDSGMMTGSVVNFDQSVWGAFSGVAPMPLGPMTLE